MLVGFTRYSQDQSFSVLGRNRAFVVVMAAGPALKRPWLGRPDFQLEWCGLFTGITSQ
jgi:hypothetical protein